MTQDLIPAAQQEFLTASIQQSLVPIVQDIDREGLYPREFLMQLGQAGGFAAAIPTQYGGLNLDLAAQIEVIAQVGRECGASAFLTWCQSSCAWYLLHTANPVPRDRYLSSVARGTLLAGTGMSNAVKHLAGIERINLHGRREGEAYRISGALPWVSNIGPAHLVIVAASLEDGGYIMFALPPDTEGVVLHDCQEFSGMEGTGTLNIRLKNVLVPDADVLAHADQFDAYLERIKPGFILTQIGMGLGIAQASVQTIIDCNVSHAHVNQYLDDQASELKVQLDTLRATTLALAKQDALAPLLDILRARARASELTLSAAQSAALHAGAKGYLMRHPAQRRLREALFVAIVTPALKHLRKEINTLENRLAA
ncbi:acyl-CoA/acyl-ACP dehydrogenase [Alcaligenaceae bacterium CGII-47]|nr:acyl-CoA/acyl-ACP dehydrogenase [Alcaligenaceae bacterium CGII-47]